MDDSASFQQPPRRNSMTQDEERERRASIQAIMRDTNLTPQERRKSIQSLMDGRRRSSVVRRDSNRSSHGGSNSMAAAAAAAAQELGSFSDDEDDAIPEDGVVEDAPANRRLSIRSSLRSSFRSGGKRSSLRGSFSAGFSSMGIDDLSGGDKTIDPIVASRKMEKSRPPCGHYQRNCSIVSPCCGLVFGCRICHDDSPTLPPPFLLSNLNHSSASFDAADAAMEDVKMPAAPNGGVAAAAATSHRSASLPTNFDDEETHHNIDRFAIREVICRECYTRQSSKTNNCINCGVQFGAYHCNICNLWMSADEDPYHCEKCGFCRVGGRENFTHCDDCGMCIDALLFYDHNCKSGKYMSNCPVCQEDLFSSRMASHEMPCGHAIHWHCFKELTSFDTRCPVCKKTAETHDQMEQTWSAMAMGIALQPVPPDMARVVDITCNDCEKKGANLRWHFLGVQCQFCTSFNTTIDGTVMTGQEAADFLGPLPIAPSHAQFAAAGVDQNVLAALMENHGDAMDVADLGEDGMDTEDFNPIVAAGVLGYMNAHHFGSSMAEDLDQEGMDEDETEDEDDDEDQSL
ncbi:hypothetical protein ACHAWX_006719 [Stephanocyclus meneghinianus]